MSNQFSSKPRRRRGLTCIGCFAIFVLGCCALGGISLAAGPLMRALRPGPREAYSAAPDRAAGEGMSNVLIQAGVEGVNVLVIPIKGSTGQIAIITLDESRGFSGFSSSGEDNLLIVVKNIVNANRQGSYNIERLSIDYRDATGRSSLAFTVTMQDAEAYANGTISREEFMGNVDFNLMDSLRYLGLDELFREIKP